MRIRVDRNVLCAPVLMLVFAMTAPAHHSFAGQFDPNSWLDLGETIVPYNCEERQ